MSIEFEWNYSKSLVNQEKHGVSFEEAAAVWDGVYNEEEIFYKRIQNDG